MPLWLAANCVVGDETGYGADREWTPVTGIAARSFVSPTPWGGETIRVSPSGRQFFVVTKRGDVESDSNIYSLHVFDVIRFPHAATRNSPEPIRNITFQSKTNTPAINDARWVDEGRGIAFLGAESNAEAQVYRLEIDTGLLEQRTNAPLGVYAFDIRDRSLIYFARVAKRGNIASSYYPARLLDRNYIEFFDQHWIGDTFATFVSLQGGVIRRVGETITYPYPIVWIGYRLSPNGRFAMMTTSVSPSRAPQGWSRYHAPNKQPGAFEESYFQRFNVVDLQSAEVRPIFDAPTGQAVENDGAVEALWHPDSSRAVLTNVCLPLNFDTEVRSKSSFVIEYSPETNLYQIIDRLQDPISANHSWLRDIEWLEPGQRLLLRYRTADKVTSGREYFRARSGWKSQAPAAEFLQKRPLSGGYSAAIQEWADRPPMLVAYKDGRTITLLPSDPALVGISMPEAEIFSWTDSRGRSWSGRLGIPRDRSPPLPLVIQIGTGADFDHFQPEGSSTTAHAAQSLTSVGIAVLRLRMSEVSGFGTTDEGPSFVAGIDSAVKELSNRGLIDRDRVGLVGHSRGGYLTQLAITHPGDVVVRAAVAADAFSGGYFEYMHVEPTSSSRVAYEQLYGGRPFWDDPTQWLALSPTFNAHRSQTPLLLEPIGLPALLGTQELYASLRLNGKPVELLYFPAGEHQLVRPSERLASMTATVDWMRFWLQDFEDPSQLKSEQFVRWRALRVLESSDR